MNAAPEKRSRGRSDNARLRRKERAGEGDDSGDVYNFLAVPFNLQTIAGQFIKNALQFCFLLRERKFTFVVLGRMTVL